ncbi:MAG TPA: cation:proton antiporter [Methanocorpusculum sp.]|nr:cation:proton antiporter [Methanocorpusculum sp.]
MSGNEAVNSSFLSSFETAIDDLRTQVSDTVSALISTAETFNAETLAITILLVLGCSLIILLIGRKLRVPAIICFFITGMIIGPYGLGIIQGEYVDVLADLGVILMMFTIGLEIPLKNLLAMKKIVLIGGTLQLVLTTAAVTGVMLAFGFAFNISLFIGFLVAHSSTAIIMNLYQRSGEIDKRHGKIALGLLIFQDLNVVPMMLMVPFLAPEGNADIIASVIKLFLGLAGLALILIIAIYLVPRILRHIALTRNGELFIIAIVVIALTIAVAMKQTGVELSLGAFLAGVAISGTAYNHEVLGQITPLRDLLTSFFFVSIGMMLDLPFVWQNLLIILGLAAILLLFKTGINFISVKAIGIGAGVGLLASVGLSQIGEFSFILGQVGLDNGILSQEIYQFFLAISIITMAATPFLVKLAPKIVDKCFKPKVPEKDENEPEHKEHEIIVGYGLAGKYVAKALEKMGIDYIVLETNAETVVSEKNNGVPIVFGDASREAVLDYAGIQKASSIVITVPIPEVVKAVVTVARRLNPGITIITRARFISDTAELYRLGADSVVVDERECAAEMFKRILAGHDIPEQEVEQLSREIRGMLYDQYIKQSVIEEKVPDENENKALKTALIPVRQADKLLSQEMSQIRQICVEHGCDACGKTLSEIHLRKNFGISILAIRHPDEVDTDVAPRGTTILMEGDIVVIMGDNTGIAKIMPLFIAKKCDCQK